MEFNIRPSESKELIRSDVTSGDIYSNSLAISISGIYQPIFYVAQQIEIGITINLISSDQNNEE